MRNRILTFCGLVLAVSLVFHFVSDNHREAVKSQRMLFNSRQTTQIETTKRAIEHVFDMVENENEFLVATYEESNFKESHIRKILSLEKDKYNGLIKGYGLFDLNKEIVVSDKEVKSWIEEIQKAYKSNGSYELYSNFELQSNSQHVALSTKIKDKGLLISIIDLNYIIKEYIEPIKVGKSSLAFLLSKDGTVIYDAEKEIIGKNIFILHKDYESLINIDKRYITEKSGTGKYEFVKNRKSEEVISKLTAWNTIELGNQKLVLCISSPGTEIEGVVSSLSKNVNIIYTLVFCVVILIYGAFMHTSKINENKELSSIFSAASDVGFVFLEKEGGVNTVKKISVGAENILGIDRIEVEGNVLDMSALGLECSDLSVSWENKMKAKCHLINKDKFVKIVIYPVKKGKKILLVITDLTEEKRNEEVLRELAIQDGLTKLYNHRETYEILERCIDSAKCERKKLSTIMLDIDYFKTVNDNYGHVVGDKVLSRIAEKIKNQVGNEGKVGRYGGEEFLIVMPDTCLIDAEIKAEEIRMCIESMKFREKDLKVTISAGVVEWNGQSAVQVVDRSDEALYTAKTNGRNRVEVYA